MLLLGSVLARLKYSQRNMFIIFSGFSKKLGSCTGKMSWTRNKITADKENSEGESDADEPSIAGSEVLDEKDF